MARVEEIKARHGAVGAKVLDVFWQVRKMVKFRVKLRVFPRVVVSRSSRGLRLRLTGSLPVIRRSFVRV
jgi:hypothetical protein